jgi:hypothetical protein
MKERDRDHTTTIRKRPDVNEACRLEEFELRLTKRGTKRS